MVIFNVAVCQFIKALTTDKGSGHLSNSSYKPQAESTTHNENHNDVDYLYIAIMFSH